MITILIISLIIGFCVILFTKLTNNQNQKELIEKINLTSANRLLKYLIFIVFSLLLPFIVTIFSILLRGSRESGMEIGFRVPFFLINFGFAFIVLNTTIKRKIISGFIVTIITLGLMFLILYSNILKSAIFEKSDSYGIWRLIFLFIIISLISWEIIYRIMYKKQN